MSNRRNFDKRTQVAIIRRATADGKVLCERCNALCKTWEIHHRDQDAMEVDKSRKLTPADGELLCKPCHKVLSKAQAPVLAKALRREAAHLGARRDKQPIKSDPHALQSRSRPKHEGRTGLPPRPMFVKLGDVASGVLAKLNPKKAAE